MPPMQGRDKIQSINQQLIAEIMDTIAINANDSSREEGKEKKEIQMNDAAKAGMAAGAAGIAAGAAAKTIFDHQTGDEVEEEVTGGDTQPTKTEEELEVPEIIEETIAEVNPDDVMLEEPEAESSTETEMIAEALPQTEDNKEPEYQPFVNNDNIVDEIVEEPAAEEVYIAENTEVDAVIDENLIEEVVLEWPEIVPGENGADVEELLLADNTHIEEEYDIQSDLMA